MKAGCTYIPLDPIYPQDRLRHVIEDSGMAALISISAQAASLPESKVPLVLLDVDAAEIAAQSPVVAALDTKLSTISVHYYSLGYRR